MQDCPQESSSCFPGIPLPNDMFDRTKYFVTLLYIQLGVTVPWLVLGARRGRIPTSASQCWHMLQGRFLCLWGCSAAVLALQDSAMLKGTQHSPPQALHPWGNVLYIPSVTECCLNETSNSLPAPRVLAACVLHAIKVP